MSSHIGLYFLTSSIDTTKEIAFASAQHTVLDTPRKEWISNGTRDPVSTKREAMQSGVHADSIALIKDCKKSVVLVILPNPKSH